MAYSFTTGARQNAGPFVLKIDGNTLFLRFIFREGQAMENKKLWVYAVPGIVILCTVFLFILLNTGFKEPGQLSCLTPRYTSFRLPDTLTFAGEQVPLEYFDVRESLEREILVNSYFHSQTIRLIKLAPRYFPVIEPILKEQGIPDDFKYLAVAESNLDPKAVSPSEAVGLWQFIESAAKQYGLEVNAEIDERYHIEKSTYAACRYLKESYEKFGNWALVAASYNSGPAYTLKQIERQKTSDYFDLLLGEETERYVFRILALKMVLESPQKFGFDIPEKERYPLIPTKEIKINQPVPSLAEFARRNGTSYKLLKMFNPWLREPYLTNKVGREYVVKIPAEGARKIKY